MKKRIFLGGLLAALVLLLLPMAAEAKETKTDRGIPVTSEYFSDKGILRRAKVYDKDQDGYLSPEEIAKLTSIQCAMDVADLSQLKYFWNLRILSLSADNMSRYDGRVLDFTIFPKLTHMTLMLDYEKPTAAVPDVKVKVSGLKRLSWLQIHNWYVDRNGKKSRTQFVDTVDLRNLPSLTGIYMNCVKGLIFDDDSEIEEIHVQNMTEVPCAQIAKLEQLERLLLWSDDPHFTAVDVSDKCFLVSLNVKGPSLEKVTTAGAEGLEVLSVKSSALKEIDLTQNPKLKRLHLSCANLRSLDLTQNPKLSRMYVGSKRIEALDLTKNPLLKELKIKAERLKALDIGENKKLWWVEIRNTGLKSLDFSENSNLYIIDVAGNALETLKLGTKNSLNFLDCKNNKLTTLDLSGVQESCDVCCDKNVKVKGFKGKVNRN